MKIVGAVLIYAGLGFLFFLAGLVQATFVYQATGVLPPPNQTVAVVSLGMAIGPLVLAPFALIWLGINALLSD